MTGRAGLDAALMSVERGAAGVLVVAKLDRLSRSLLDFANLMERSRRKRWALVALDLGVGHARSRRRNGGHVDGDFRAVRTPHGWRPHREALAAKRASGVRLGRPPALAPSVVQRIQQARSSGQTLAAIAGSLNAEGVPTAHGGAQWHRHRPPGAPVEWEVQGATSQPPSVMLVGRCPDASR